MRSPDTHSADAAKPGYLFAVYTAGAAPNSVRAVANLYAVCDTHFPGCHRIVVIDVLQEPLRALAAGVFVTPTVIRVLPAPLIQIIGNLSDEAEVLRALGLAWKATP